MNESTGNLDQQQQQQPKLDPDDSTFFYFESDCAALRHNADYSCLLRTFALLEAQRVQACLDLERLVDVRERLLVDATTRPSDFVKHVLPGLDLPERQKVYCLPHIEWAKYFQIGGGNSGSGGAGGSGSGVDADTLELIRQQNMVVNRSRRIQQQQQQSGRYSVNHSPYTHIFSINLE